MNLKALEKFKDVYNPVKLTKLSSKRPNSMVEVGHIESGEFSLVNIGEDVAVMVVGNGFNILRTSPIVKIIDENETSVTFETEGGTYRVEKV